MKTNQANVRHNKINVVVCRGRDKKKSPNLHNLQQRIFRGREEKKEEEKEEEDERKEGLANKTLLHSGIWRRL